MGLIFSCLFISPSFSPHYYPISTPKNSPPYFHFIYLRPSPFYLPYVCDSSLLPHPSKPISLYASLFISLSIHLIDSSSLTYGKNHFLPCPSAFFFPCLKPYSWLTFKVLQLDSSPKFKRIHLRNHIYYCFLKRSLLKIFSFINPKNHYFSFSIYFCKNIAPLP